MNTIILFDENKIAVGLSGDDYQGPMLSAKAPDNFDANNWFDYTLTEDNQVILLASQTSLEQSCQLRLDLFAQTKGYNSILSACSYANSPNAIFQLEGTYALQARDDTWNSLYNIFDEVHNKTRPPIKTFSEIEPELPVLKWPDANNSNTIIVTTDENTGNNVNTSNVVVDTNP